MTAVWNQRLVLVLTGGALMTALALTSTGAAPSAQQTVADLKTAYVGETTAHARYLAFARQAQQEGYPEVAHLFRAAAVAESIHARNHQAVLAKLGATAEPGSFTTAPGTTAENLREAIAGESYERDAMYPQMILHARAARQTDAVRSLTYAREAEKQHAALYAQALKELDRAPRASVYYVCPMCGATYANQAPHVVPTCGTPRAKLKRVP